MPTMHHRTAVNILVVAVWISVIAACTYLTVRDHVFVGLLVLFLGTSVGVCREKLSEGAGASEDDK